MTGSKQAKILSEAQERQAKIALRKFGKYRKRNFAMFLLSVKAGLRAKEIALLKWYMVTDPSGEIGHSIMLTNNASKGKHGGREIKMNSGLRKALVALKASYDPPPSPRGAVIRSERGGHLRPHSVVEWFARLYREADLVGCSSHSGRRTFVTRVARKIVLVGGSLRDVQLMAGHRSLTTTQRYIEGDSEAQRRVVELI